VLPDALLRRLLLVLHATHHLLVQLELLPPGIRLLWVALTNRERAGQQWSSPLAAGGKSLRLFCFGAAARAVADRVGEAIAKCLPLLKEFQPAPPGQASLLAMLEQPLGLFQVLAGMPGIAQLVVDVRQPDVDVVAVRSDRQGVLQGRQRLLGLV